MTPTRRSTLICTGLACAVMAVAVAGIAWWNRHPAVDQAQAQAIEPVIETYMHKNAAQFGIGEVLDSRLKPQVFCDVNIIEISPEGSRFRVGMIMNCAEYARRGNLLIEGSMGNFTSVGQVMIPAHSRQYRVLSVDPGPDGYDPAWVHQNFSPLAARWLLSSDPPTASDPISQADKALGFPPGTQAVQD
jgi:hypothetical protein